jgi:pimeloyl-ACP methyl ester carboxylesterase
MPIKEDYSYTEIGNGPIVLVLHGLFGSLSNFETMMKLAGNQYRFVMPYLPLYDCELKHSNLDGMIAFIKGFVDFMGFKDFSILGNSLGGHLALLYTIQHPTKVKSLILTASSGLFENSLGNEYPKRDKEYLRSKISETFGNKSIVTEELVSEIETIVNSRSNAIRIIKMAKSATRQNLLHCIHTITHKTLLIWGREDSITPPFVAEKFHQLMPNSELVWIDGCGHAPMMEFPKEFSDAMLPFLNKVYKS